MEPGGSVLCSQEPTIGPYHKPVGCRPHCHTLLFKTNFNIVPFMHRSSKWTAPFRFTNQNFVSSSHLSHVYYMFCPSHSRFEDLNMIWLRVHIMKLLIVQFSSSFFYLPPLRFIYFHHHPFLNHHSLLCAEESIQVW
jgi:hypothetical protein